MGEEGITVADVFDKISKRLVPFEMVDKVFKDLTSEGGKFFQMQEIQSETLKGKISNLKDAYMIMFNEIGSRQDGLLKGGVDALRGLAENYEKVGRAIVSLISIYGGYKATLALISVWQSAEVLAMTKGIGAITKFGKALALAITQSKAFAAVQKFISGINPWAAIGAAVTAVGSYFVTAAIQASRFRNELEGIAQTKFDEAEKSVETFKRLVDQLKNATEGSQSYRDAISQLNRQYGDYLPNLLNEKNALTEILKVENEVTNAIYARAKAYASEEGLRKIEERYGGDISKFGESLVEFISYQGYGEDAARDFIKGFRSALQDNPEKNGLDVFQETFKKYFGEDSWDKISSTAIWQEQLFFVKDYANAVQSLTKENNKFLEKLDTRFGSQGYSSNLERQISEPIVAAYNKALQELRNQKLPSEEFAEKATALELARLHQLKQAFEGLNTEGVWTTKIKEIQAQIDALKPKDAGWLQKLVNPLVTGKGNNDLKAQVEDGYKEYVDKIRKEYKAVSEAYADSNETYNKLNADKKKGIEVDEDVLRKATEQNELYKQRKKVIEDIGAALGVSVDDKVKKTKSHGKSQAQKDIETRIDLLKKLQSAYEKLSEYVGDDKIGDVLGNIFSSSEVEGKDDIIKNLNYRKQILDEAAKLEKYDKDAAERLRSYVGYDEVSEQINAYKELAKARKQALSDAEKYYDLMREWFGKDFDLGGEGVVFDISKIVANLSNEFDKIDQKSERARELLTKAQSGDEQAVAEMRKKYGDEFWEHYIQKGSEAIDELSRKEKEASRKTAQEKINDLAQKYVKEKLFTANFDTKELADKNIIQILKLKDRLQEIMDENPLRITAELAGVLDSAGVSKLENGEYDLSLFDIDSLGGISDANRNLLGLIKTAQKAKLSFSALNDDVSKIFGSRMTDIKQAAFKSILEQIRDAMQIAEKIGDALQKIGEMTGNDSIKGAGEAVEGIASIGGSIVQGLMSGGVFGAAVAGATELIKQFANGFMEAEQSARATRKAVDDFAQSVKMAELDNLISGSTGIFGNNTIANLQKDQTALKKAYDAIIEQEKKFLEDEKLMLGESRDKKWWQEIGQIFLPGIYQTLSGWTKIAAGQWDWADILNVVDAGLTSQILDPMGLEKFAYEMLSASDSINVFAAAFKNMQVKTKDYNGFLEFFGARDEYMSLGDFFPDLFNDDGTINYDLLDEAISAIESNGVQLTDAQKKMLDTMKANYEKYKDAMDGIRDYLSDIFGDVANTIADGMIDAFARSGDAAIEMGDIFSDVTKKMAKDLIVNILYTKVFDQLQDRVLSMYDRNSGKYIEDSAARTESALLAFRDGLAEVSALSPEITAILQGLQDTLGVSFSDSADNLADGIKGITEDTANLLASYLNAIRADVSMSKAQRDNILAEIKNIASYVASPTLMDYVNRIQANTYDNARATESILADIRSMMTTDGGFTALRVYS